MACKFYAEKGSHHYCTSKKDYISCYCPYDDPSCRYYIDESGMTDTKCPFWHEHGAYCEAKKGYINCYGDNYETCTYYIHATNNDADRDDEYEERRRKEEEEEERRREEEEEERRREEEEERRRRDEDW